MTYKLITESTPFLSFSEEEMLNRLNQRAGLSEATIEKQNY